jgi:hypothetical protein
MGSVTYSMGVSLGGYIVGPDGGFDWTAPDEEVFRFVTHEIRQVGVHLLGRRLPGVAGDLAGDRRPAQRGLDPGQPRPRVPGSAAAGPGSRLPAGRSGCYARCR